MRAARFALAVDEDIALDVKQVDLAGYADLLAYAWRVMSTASDMAASTGDYKNHAAALCDALPIQVQTLMFDGSSCPRSFLEQWSEGPDGMALRMLDAEFTVSMLAD